MKFTGSRIFLFGITVILMAGVLGASAAETVTGLQSVVKQLGRESDFEKTGEVLFARQ